jgi:hypothetical protein
MPRCTYFKKKKKKKPGKLQSFSLPVGFNKGGLISESFSLWLKSPKMGAKSLT